MNPLRRIFNMCKLLFPALAVIWLSGCTKGSSATSPSSVGTVNISGRAILGPVSGATVTAYHLNADGTRGAILGTATTAADGTYTLNSAADSGAVILVMTGGSYTEESTGTVVSVGTTEITAVVTALSANQTVAITPLTDIAAERALVLMAAGALSTAAIASANQAVAIASGLSVTADLTAVMPANTEQSLASQNIAVNSDQAKYALFLASLSQYGHDHGGVNSLAVMNAFASDMKTDGVFDGSDAGSAVTVAGGPVLSSSAWSSGLYLSQSIFILSVNNISAFTTDSFTLPVALPSVQAALPAGATSGSLVPGFGVAGVVMGSLTSYAQQYGNVAHLAAQADGKVVGCGTMQDSARQYLGPFVMRFNADGSLDTTFGDQGRQVISMLPMPVNGYASPITCTSILVQADGKIVLLGADTISYSGTFLNEGRPQIVRLLSNGAMDTTFGTGGVSMPTLVNFVEALSMAIQSDDKIVVGASMDTPGIALFRLNTDGALDTTFGDPNFSGLTSINTGFVRPQIYSVYVQADNKIVVGGAQGTQGFAARLLADGTADLAFGPDGTGVVGLDDALFAGALDVRAIAVQTSGKLVFSGLATNGAYAMRLDASASAVDATFGTSGTASLDIGVASEGHIFVMQGDDKMILAANGGIDNDAFQVRRLSINGVDDGTFSSSLHTQTTLPFAMTASPLGGIFLSRADHWVLQRINSSGTFDSAVQAGAFDDTTVRAVTIANKGINFVNASTTTPDGKTVVVGYSMNSNLYDTHPKLLLLRYNADGSLDSTFGTGGIVDDSTIFQTGAYAIAAQPDGSILIGGASPISQFAVARFSAAGVLDTSFGTGGVASATIHFGALLNSILVQPDGKILVGGYSSISGGDIGADIVRFTTAGALDTSFGNAGIYEALLGSNAATGLYDSEVISLVLQPNGMIVAGVQGLDSLGAPNYIVTRVTAAGATDTSFGVAGVFSMDFPATVGSRGAYLHNIFSRSDGSIIVVGTTRATGVAMIKLDSTGVLDSTFATAGVLLNPENAGSGVGYIRAAAVDTYGRILVSGESAAGYGITRYTSAGTVDSTFGTSGTVTLALNTGEWTTPYSLGFDATGAITYTALGAGFDGGGQAQVYLTKFYP